MKKAQVELFVVFSVQGVLTLTGFWHCPYCGEHWLTVILTDDHTKPQIFRCPLCREQSEIIE